MAPQEPASPTSAQTRWALVQQLFQLIGELNREGLAILLVEQNTAMALATASRGLVLELGRAVISGSAHEIRSNERLTDAYLGSH